eukprot:scaffold251728_cov36-Prasinocladus_malaysianus.AAC.2
MRLITFRRRASLRPEVCRELEAAQPYLQCSAFGVVNHEEVKRDANAMKQEVSCHGLAQAGSYELSPI